MNSCIRIRHYRQYGYAHLMTIVVAGYSRDIIIGPHWWGVLCTILVIIFGTSSNLFLAHRVRSEYLRNFLIFFVYSCSAIVHILLLLTATTNPGIVFPLDTAHSNSRYAEEPDNADIEESSPILQGRSTATVADHHDGHGSNWCDICDVEQSRAQKIRHCDSCGYCIRGLDHHCPWMGQCVGKGNMYWFVLFNISWIALFLEYVILAAVYIF